jgi:uncharacterized phage infection (PIP) family protein YhgE
LTSLAAALAAVFALAACGGSSSSTVTPAAYVHAVCQAVGPFESDVVKKSAALNLSNINSPAQGKTALQGFLTSVSNDTKQALNKLKAAGTPNVKNGKQIANAISGAFAQLDTTMTGAVKQAQALPVNNVTAFKAGAQKLGTTVRTSMSNIGTNLSSGTLKSPQLEQAAAKDGTCKSLSS